jgi:integrase
MPERIHIDKGATLFKLSGYPTWYLDLCARGGRDRRSLGTTNKERALAIARQLVQEKLYESWGVPQLQDVLFAEFEAEYQKYGETNNEPPTNTLNFSTIGLFRTFMIERKGTKAELRLSDVTPDDVEAYKAWRKGALLWKKQKPISPTTVNRELGVIHAFYELALEKGRARRNPASRIKKLTFTKRLPKVLYDEQTLALLDELRRPVPLLGPGGKGNGRTRPRILPLYDLALLILETGLRLGEILHLKWEDIDFSRRVMVVRWTSEYHIKDKEERPIGLNRGALAVLKRRKSRAGSSQWVFTTQNGTLISNTNALKEFKKAAARAKVPWANFRILRASMATRSAEVLLPFVLKNIMGHASIRTTEKFYVNGQSWSKIPTPPTLSLRKKGRRAKKA